jgi:hypothetical protein
MATAKKGGFTLSNLCCSTVTFVADATNPNEIILIQLLDKLLEKWKNNKEECSLQQIVEHSGIGDVKCVGDLLQHSVFSNKLEISTVTAWVPMLQIWKRLRDKFCPNATLFYSSEESGMELFYTNDPEVVGNFYLEIENDDGDFDVYENVKTEKALEILQKRFHTYETNFDTISELAENNGITCNIHQWQYADIDEWD